MFHQEDGDACKWSLCIVMLRHAKTIIRKTRWDLPRSQKLRKVWKWGTPASKNCSCLSDYLFIFFEKVWNIHNIQMPLAGAGKMIHSWSKLELCGHGTQVNHVVPHGLLIWHSHACKRMLRLHVTREKEGPQNMLQACDFQSHCWWLSHTKNMSIGARIIIYHNRPNCLFPSNRQQKTCLEPTINSCLLSFPAVNFSETLQL